MLTRQIHLLSTTYGAQAQLDRAATQIERILNGWENRNENSKTAFIAKYKEKK